METIIIESRNPENLKVIKAFLDALDIDYSSTKNVSRETIEQAGSILKGYQEAKMLDEGKKKVKTYSNLNELMDDL